MTAADAESTDSQLSIKLPELKYGYRTERCTWDELVNIMLVQNDVAKLSRSQEQQYQYELYKHDILRQWSTMTDYVLYTKFPDVFTKKEATTTSQERRSSVVPPLESISTTHTSLTKNDFPYFMADGIEHWVLWKLGSDSSITDIDIDRAKQELVAKHNFIHHDLIIHWTNPLAFKSIPNIEHAHFLGRVTN